MTFVSSPAEPARRAASLSARNLPRVVLERLWDRLPARARTALNRTGLPYTASYLWNYRTRYAAERFAGELQAIHQQYKQAQLPEQRALLIERFDAVLDSLILPNGVRKTSYAARQAKSIRSFLSREGRAISSRPLRVLDLPCSSGVAALDTLAQLREVCEIREYVLSDLNFEVFLDQTAGCIYDEAGNLLQVRGRKRFVSIHRPHARGEVYSFVTDVLLWPLSLRARRLLSKYGRPRSPDLVPISLLHPEVQAMVSTGIFKLERVDVFNIAARAPFDIIISFNLLQRNYFSAERIADGVANLRGALHEGGYLIMGNTESFGIQRKDGSELVTVYREGEW